MTPRILQGDLGGACGRLPLCDGCRLALNISRHREGGRGMGCLSNGLSINGGAPEKPPECSYSRGV